MILGSDPVWIQVGPVKLGPRWSRFGSSKASPLRGRILMTMVADFIVASSPVRKLEFSATSQSLALNNSCQAYVGSASLAAPQFYYYF